MQNQFDPARPSFHLLQKLDARVKFILTLAFILALGLSPAGAWPAYVLFAALVISLEIISGIGIRYYLTRSMLALGFALAALPVILQPGEEQIIAFHAAGTTWVVTWAGLERFFSILIKSWLSMQAALLLAATTPFTQLLTAMRQLHFPKILVLIMSLMWRYLFVLGDEAQRLIAARVSRSAVPANASRRPPLAWRAQVTGGMAGSLLLRSIERSERVYVAMLARGYSGEPPVVATRQPGRQDKVWLFSGLFVSVAIWFLSLMFGD